MANYVEAKSEENLINIGKIFGLTKGKSEIHNELQAILCKNDWIGYNDSMGLVFYLVKNSFHEELRIQKFLKGNHLALLHVYIAHLRK